MNGALAPPVVRKQVFCQNFQLQSTLIPEFATRWEVSPIWACSACRVLSEYTSYTPGAFREYGAKLDEVSGGVAYEKISKTLLTAEILGLIKNLRRWKVDFEQNIPDTFYRLSEIYVTHTQYFSLVLLYFTI